MCCKVILFLTIILFQSEAVQKRLCEEFDVLEVKVYQIHATEALVNSLEDGYSKIEDRLFVMQENTEFMVDTMEYVSDNIEEMQQIVNGFKTK